MKTLLHAGASVQQIFERRDWSFCSSVGSQTSGGGRPDSSNGALLAVLLGAWVDYSRWLRFVMPGVLLVALVGLAGMALVA